MKKVTIIIVNWNGHIDTLRCLSSVYEMDIRGYDMRVIMVDNASKDNSVELVHRKYPQIQIIKNTYNAGFTGANNQGIRQAMKDGSDYIWLLNNDTVVDKKALTLTGAFDDPTVGIAVSKVYFYPGSEYHKNRYQKREIGKVLWYAGGIIDWNNMYASHRGVDEVDKGQFDETTYTAFATGCSMMISRSSVDRVGELDERYYLYLEDVEYSLRMLNAGIKIAYYPTSVVWHANAGSSGGSGSKIQQYYMTRNRILIARRYASMRTNFAILRESIRFALIGTSEIKAAIRDAYFGRWGKRYE